MVRTQKKSKVVTFPAPPVDATFLPKTRALSLRLLLSVLGAGRLRDALDVEADIYARCNYDGGAYRESITAAAYAARTPGASVACILDTNTEGCEVVKEVRAVQARREGLMSEKTAAAAVSASGAAPAECAIQCRRCRSTEVSIEQKQTRGADEAMTSFVQCNRCSLRWKL